MKNRGTTIIFTSFLVFIFILTLPAFSAGDMERGAGYYTVLDEQGRELLATSQHLQPGDRFISADNYEYRIIKIKGEEVYTKKLGSVKLIDKKAKSFLDRIRGFFKNKSSEELAIQGVSKRPICIYHTHNDESYIPSDGADSILDKGGIVKVGEVMVNAFEKNGVAAIHSKVSHAPHDGMAYERSRATAAQLLKKIPIALIDVHRDAAPGSNYAKVIEGKSYTQMMMVMGNQNPNYKSNVAFAKKVKASIDKVYPGLTKGILIKSGKYNQDLSTHAFLLEVGSQYNTRESAERTANAFAAATSSMMTGTGAESAQGTNGEEVRANISSGLIWIVIIGLGGSTAFLFLNEDRIRGIKRKLRQIKRTEFVNALKNEPDIEEESENFNHDEKDIK